MMSRPAFLHFTGMVEVLPLRGKRGNKLVKCMVELSGNRVDNDKISKKI